MIRWNANFVRGLAQSVLDRARQVRSSLTQYASPAESPVTVPEKRRKRKKAAVKRARAPRRPNG